MSRLFAAVGICLAVAAAASAVPAAAEESPPASGGTALLPFQLEASNGYDVVGWAATKKLGEPGILNLIVSGSHGSVDYYFPAEVGDGTVSADLGSLGRIELVEEATGEPRPYESPCGGKSLTLPNIEFRGLIQFRGEDGYTRVTAESAPADPQFILGILCAGFSGEYGAGRGADLRAHNATKSGGPSGVEFEALTNGPRKEVLLTARTREKRGRVRISRSVSYRVGPGAFFYDPLHMRTATVKPNAEAFSGSAVLTRTGRDVDWRGNLSVDFPGRAGVRLAGDDFEAGLQRASYTTLPSLGQLFRP